MLNSCFGNIGCFPGLICYLAIAFILFKIGQKFNVGSFLGWCIPLYNIHLLCQCAKITSWWVLACLIPGIGFLAGIYIWGSVSARLGKEFWLWGIVCTFLGLPIAILAFDDSYPVANPKLPNF
jgi:hypothetical protein